MSTQAVKPQLRNLYQSQIKKNLIGMMIFSLTGAVMFKILVADKRKQIYADFYRYVADVLNIPPLSILISFYHHDCCIHT